MRLWVWEVANSCINRNLNGWLLQLSMQQINGCGGRGLKRLKAEEETREGPKHPALKESVS